MSQFEAGDIVVLKSGGPDMTVIGKLPRGGYTCRWFISDELKKEEFSENELEKKAPPKKMPVFKKEDLDKI